MAVTSAVRSATAFHSAIDSARSGVAAVPVDADDALAEVLALVDGGARLKDASAEVAGRTGLSRKALYDAALAARAGR